VEALLAEADDAARTALLAVRLDGPVAHDIPGPRACATRSEADRLSADVMRLREVATRLEARLMARPLDTFPEAASELLVDALVGVAPVLRRLEAVIARLADEALAS